MTMTPEELMQRTLDKMKEIKSEIEENEDLLIDFPGDISLKNCLKKLKTEIYLLEELTGIDYHDLSI